MLELYFLTYLSIFFSIYQDAYVNVNSLYIKFLHNFLLHISLRNVAMPSATVAITSAIYM